MGKYCCFFDPASDYAEKNLADLCPKCGRSYEFVLENKPQEIENEGKVYSVLEAVGRGFYGATYLCEVQKRFGKEQVLLKVTPVDLYAFFGKNFEEECQKHAEVAEKTEHLVKILDAFDADVLFGTEHLRCHIAELQYIKGQVLFDYIEEPSHNQSKVFAQIAIDLLKLWNELVARGEFHNDLHLGNLIVEQLDNSMQRVDAIYDRIRLVAIDLNSVKDKSLSNPEENRFGDRQYIASHISLMSDKLRGKYNNIDEISDTDFRLIETLNKISRILSAPAQAGDIPEISELIEMIKEELKSNISYAPWKKTFTLSKLNDGINAQTLPSCYVPQLLVDPENKWIEEVSVSGPQLITGMRGCGKTMLLAALDVHARLMVPATNPKAIYNSLEDDRYIGVMASCRELAGLGDIEVQGMSKLILLYSIQIIRAVRHIKDINSQKVEKEYHRNIAEKLSTIFSITFDEKTLYSDAIFERNMSDLSNRIGEFCDKYTLRVSCIDAFELLAEALTASSDILYGKQVYFLLDDASTRYMPVTNISALLTKVLFMSQKCAFKVTTELQTLYSFKSPGNVEMAHDIRDYQIFDLGADVFKRTRQPTSGKKFIESIIARRLKACNESQNMSSLEKVLGDCPLIDLAHYITENTSSKERKTVYYGATALTALCVGDIGDIIFLYESIISNNSSGVYPVKKTIQTQCFQQLCSRRMYNLERKDGALREYVKAFSEASYKSLMDSKKAMKEDKSKRIRQYNSLYIRITSGDLQKQQEQLRSLIDSGIFVYADGSGWPRSKSTDTDPMTQIKLAFRKLFGVSNFIPLGNSDRYELSGEALEQWLEKPTKELLLKNLGSPNEKYESEEAENVVSPSLLKIQDELEIIVGKSCQLSMFNAGKEIDGDTTKEEARRTLSDDILKRAKIVSHRKPLANMHFDVGVFGLGFEERCLESVKRVVGSNSFKQIIFVTYDEKGFSDEILKTVSNSGSIVCVRFDELEKITGTIKDSQSVLVDMSGLYKPAIFDVVRKSVIYNKKVVVVHTAARDYFPLNSDIQELIGTKKIDDATRFADLMKGLDTGDTGSYYNMKLLGSENYDPVRPTALVGFVSPKNQRVFSILDKTEYDAVSLYIPDGDTPRDMLSRTAGDIAATNYLSVKLIRFNISSPQKVLRELSKSYANLYIDKNYNFEISLTGSKMQAFVAAVFSSVCKVAQCWYVKPSQFDVKHFTKGVGETRWYSVEIARH